MNRRTFLVRTAGLAAAGLFSRSFLGAQAPSTGSTSSPQAGSGQAGSGQASSGQAGSRSTSSGSSTPQASPGQEAAARPAPKPPVTEFKPLRRDTGIFTGRGGTIGWLASPAALVVIDTQFPDTAPLCLAGLPGREGRMLDAVINTHHHHDHTAGNPVFKPATRTIVAQANVPRLQAAAAERSGTVADEVYADTTFTNVWRHDCGSETVLAQYFGPAHTSGDAVIIFEKANVVHMGDLVFNRLYPYIDRPAGASVRGWVQRLEEVHRTFPADAIYIFGHGQAKFGVTGTRDDLLVMRDLLVGLLDYVQKGLTAGKTKDQITALDNLPGFPDYHVPAPNRLPSILGTVYDELAAQR